MLVRKLMNILARVAGRAIVPPGITIGRNVHLGAGVALDWSHGHHITIEDDVTLAAESRILAHDASSYRRTGLTWVAPVLIQRGAFIGSRALIMPGVTIGERAVVAAGSVVTSNVAPGCVVAGCPARQISTTAELDDRRIALANEIPVFPESVYNHHPLSSDVVAELRQAAGPEGYFLARVPGHGDRGKVSLDHVIPSSSAADDSANGSAQ